jgi:hypothetical protein
MGNGQQLAVEAVERLAKLWQVDSERMVRTEQGFDWWPSQFRTSVMTTERVEEGEPACRVVVRTDLMRDVDLGASEIRERIALLAALSPTYSWVYPPPEVIAQHDLKDANIVWLQSTAYLRPDIMTWLPEFLGGMALLQAIFAHEHAAGLAEFLHCKPHRSAPGGEADSFVDSLLGVGKDFYGPAGSSASKWLGCVEFSEVAERFGRSDQCFGTGDPNGLTLETPIGESSALIGLRPEVRHPQLGSGLLASVELPFNRPNSDMVEECLGLNFHEATFWTDVPQFGSWHPQQRREETFHAGNGFFIPNALYRPGLATNAALWQVGRARWVKNTLYPDLKDLSMSEVIQRRMA